MWLLSAMTHQKRAPSYDLLGTSTEAHCHVLCFHGWNGYWLWFSAHPGDRSVSNTRTDILCVLSEYPRRFLFPSLSLLRLSLPRAQAISGLVPAYNQLPTLIVRILFVPDKLLANPVSTKSERWALLDQKVYKDAFICYYKLQVARFKYGKQKH